MLIDERLADNADALGAELRRELGGLVGAASGGLVASVRGKGLLNAMVINVSEQSDPCRFLCLLLWRCSMLCT